MLQTCQAYSLEDTAPTLLGDAYDKAIVPRWLTCVFWELTFYARDVSNHPAWAATIAREPDYYAAAYQRLEDLAEWFFMGETGRPNPMAHFKPI